MDFVHTTIAIYTIVFSFIFIFYSSIGSIEDNRICSLYIVLYAFNALVFVIFVCGIIGKVSAAIV